MEVKCLPLLKLHGKTPLAQTSQIKPALQQTMVVEHAQCRIMHVLLGWLDWFNMFCKMEITNVSCSSVNRRPCIMQLRMDSWILH